MKYIFILLFFLSSMVANSNLLEIYRTSGINGVELFLNKQLAEKSFWLETIQNKNTSLGYYESIDNIISASKNFKNIKIYNTKKDDVTFSSNVVTGEADGDKEKEGDLKTPLGAYNITQIKTKLDQFYGPLAMVTNYPNRFDKMQGKTGSGIWIHGFPLSGEREPFTKGCIAMENNQLKELKKHIPNHKKTLVLIDNEETNISKETLATVLSQIFTWKQAWQENNLTKYLSFYDTTFKKSDGKDIKRFTKHKKAVFARNQPKSIQYKNLNVIPYPNSLGKQIFKVTFYQVYNAPNYKSKGNKELYLELSGEQIKIIFET